MLSYQSKNGLDKSFLEKRIIYFLKTVQQNLNLSDSEMAKLLNLTPASFTKIMNFHSVLYISNFQDLLDQLNVDFNAVILGKINYDLIFEQFYGKKSELPEYYLSGAFGKKRTLINIFDYLETYYGALYKNLILREFQLTPKHFNDPEGLINNNFIVDLFNKLEEKGHSRDEFIKMGAFSYESNKNGPLGKTLKNLKSPKEVVEFIFEGGTINRFDENFTYQLTKLTSTECRLQISQNKNVAEALKKGKIGSLNLSLSKVGVMSSFPVYAGFNPSKTTLSKCAHMNSTYCELITEFDNRKVHAI